VKTDRVISLIQPDNIRSIRVAEKLGQRFERTETVSGADMQVFAVHRSRVDSRKTQQNGNPQKTLKRQENLTRRLVPDPRGSPGRP
jgi:hypothetical protein